MGVESAGEASGAIAQGAGNERRVVSQTSIPELTGYRRRHFDNGSGSAAYWIPWNAHTTRPSRLQVILGSLRSLESVILSNGYSRIMLQ